MTEKDSTKSHPALHEILPRETAGRDTIARYQAQFRAAAFECLSLLKGGALDRVYCDYHDDYVTRFKLKDGRHVYNFYQVKTKSKENHQWSITEVFGLYKKRKSASPTKIADSVAGKLLQHIIRFNNSCCKVVLQTNVQFDENVLACLAVASDDKEENYYFDLLLKNFNTAFSPTTPLDDDRVIELLKKLYLESGISYLTPNNKDFSALARQQIFKYSEIDLQYNECEKIINNLITLVERKSFAHLAAKISQSSLDETIGIGILEMLEILSISKGAYQVLKNGGDTSAIKNASIIQRLLEESDAPINMIEYASRCKIDWDIWLRKKRHHILEFELISLQEKIDQIASSWSHDNQPINFLKNEIDTLFGNLSKNFSNILSQELLLGAVFSSMVRNESQ